MLIEVGIYEIMEYVPIYFNVAFESRVTLDM